MRIVNGVVQWQSVSKSPPHWRFNVPLQDFPCNLCRFQRQQITNETLRLLYPQQHELPVQQLFASNMGSLWAPQFGPMTQYLESIGKLLIANNFDFPQLQDFIWWVCQAWGAPAKGQRGNRGRGIREKVLTSNTQNTLIERFKEAHAMLSENMVIEAVAALWELRELGISYSSKLLKFLDPDQAVVLDSRIRTLGYSDDLSGYGNFLDDCHEILTALQAQHIRYPGWALNGWRVSDVEMAIFDAL